VPSPALAIDDLTVAYAGRVVVDHLSLAADAGRVTAVLGPNGAGKTTTIECAEGLRRPDSGSITVLGHPAGSPAARARVGVMLQDGGLPMARSATEVLSLVAAMHGRSRDVGPLLSRLVLTDVARTPVRRLSGGQRQRVSLGAAILAEPDLLFLDEPSAGLDPQSRRLVWDLVRSLRDGGVAVVLTTHLLEEAEALADVVHVLAAGRLVASGSPAELVERYAGPDTVHLRLSTPLSDDHAARLVRDVGASTPPAGRGAPPRGSGPVVTLHHEPTPAFIAAVASWCAEQDVRLRSLDVGGGTLEDAYLALTSPAGATVGSLVDDGRAAR